LATFRNIIYFPFIYLRLISNLRVQKKFLSDRFKSSLLKYEHANDGSLKEKDFKKIYGYYGLAVPAILGESFAILHGKSLDDNERMVLTSQGIITGLFDDFIDDSNLTDDYISNLVNHPETVKPSNHNEKLWLKYYLQSLNMAKLSKENKDQAIKVMHDQFDSKEQQNWGIEYERLWKITQNKGGNSVLYFRFGLDEKPDRSEIKALFQLGVVMQLENDIFDVYKDLKSNIITIPNSITVISDLRSLFKKQIELFIEYSFKMNFESKNVVRFLDMIMPVINRGFVCIDQFEKLEVNNNGVFEPKNYTRKQLICDMEKPVNILNTLIYTYKNSY
jgi:hypothetical protein